MVHAALALQTMGKNSRDYMLVLLFLLLKVNVEGKDARAERAALKRRRRQKMKRLQQTSDTKASRSRRY